MEIGEWHWSLKSQWWKIGQPIGKISASENEVRDSFIWRSIWVPQIERLWNCPDENSITASTATQSCTPTPRNCLTNFIQSWILFVIITFLWSRQNYSNKYKNLYTKPESQSNNNYTQNDKWGWGDLNWINCNKQKI